MCFSPARPGPRPPLIPTGPSPPRPSAQNPRHLNSCLRRPAHRSPHPHPPTPTHPKHPDSLLTSHRVARTTGSSQPPPEAGSASTAVDPIRDSLMWHRSHNQIQYRQLQTQPCRHGPADIRLCLRASTSGPSHFYVRLRTACCGRLDVVYE